MPLSVGCVSPDLGCDPPSIPLTKEDWCCLLAWLALTYLQIASVDAREARALYDRVRQWALVAPADGSITAGNGLLVWHPWVGAPWILRPGRGKAYAWMVPGGVFGAVWGAAYAVVAVTLWSAARDPTILGDNADFLYTAALVHLMLNKLWTPLFWGAARAAATQHDLVYHLRFSRPSKVREVAALPPAQWVQVAGHDQEASTTANNNGGALWTLPPPSFGYFRVQLLLSVLVIFGNLVSAAVVTDALRRFGRTTETWLWVGYCVWLGYAAILNCTAAAYYWTYDYQGSPLRKARQ